MAEKFTREFLIVTVIVSLIVGGSAGVLGGLFLTPAIKSLPLAGKFFSDYERAMIENKTVVSVEEESATISAVAKVSPSVVSIIVSKELTEGLIDPFNPFGPQLNPESGESQRVGGGTGFIVSADGLILTNKHVVSDEAAEYSVVMADGREFEAKILARDFNNDLAIIKIEAVDLPVVNLGDSDALELGQTVIAIGYTLGEYQNTVTKGIISGIDRRVVAGSNFQADIIDEALQTDAAINPGNSGGPLINLSGEVVGINTAVNREGESIGFAIPINVAKQVVNSVKEFGEIVRPWLGVRYQNVTSELAKANEISVDYGALIVAGRTDADLAVAPGSPADKAGLEANDIILEINGVKLDKVTLATEIQKYGVDDEIELKVWHDGEVKVVKVKLEKRES
ncbi:TPA: hypothetical protein DF272_04825 [Candidatus Falkowbacteria bacterium]|nr:hypothetical protein [Candidatus Falkowbacteria bacterium]